MITEKMLSAINDIDDEMIADAAPGSRYEKISYARRRRRIYRVASLAACLCIVVAVLAVTGLGNSRMNHAGGENSLAKRTRIPLCRTIPKARRLKIIPQTIRW